jgi:hypothetical protein
MIHIDINKLGRIDGIEHRITGDRSGQSNSRSRGNPGDAATKFARQA